VKGRQATGYRFTRGSSRMGLPSSSGRPAPEPPSTAAHAPPSSSRPRARCAPKWPTSGSPPDMSDPPTQTILEAGRDEQPDGTMCLCQRADHHGVDLRLGWLRARIAMPAAKGDRAHLTSSEPIRRRGASPDTIHRASWASADAAAFLAAVLDLGLESTREAALAARFPVTLLRLDLAIAFAFPVCL
jgi:hypothetical protein